MTRRKLSKSQEKLLRLFTPTSPGDIRPLWRWDFFDRIIACAIKGGATGEDLARLWGAISKDEMADVDSIVKKARRAANLTPFKTHLSRDVYFSQRKLVATMEALASKCQFRTVQGLREWEKRNLTGEERMDTRALLRANRQRKP